MPTIAAEVTGVDANFWHERWAADDIGFHQPHIHDQLQRFWPALGLDAGAHVLVPLCGKSRDMVWLAGKGHAVSGVELSEIAITSFFDAQSLTPRITTDGAFTRYAAGPYSLFKGDMFAFDPGHERPIAACYDRAALVALPADLRKKYAATLARIMPAGSKTLLIALDYPAGEIDGPPFAVTPAEIDDLFGAAFDITCLEHRDGLAASANLKARGVTRLDERAYLLVRRP